MLIAPDHIESGTGRVLRYETSEAQAAISGKYSIAPGDVLLSKIRPALRKVAYSEVVGLCSADIYPLRAGPEIDPKYLFTALLSPEFTAFAESLSGRSGIPKINRNELAEYRIALPPLAEQRRIVEILESVNESIRSAERLISKLKQHREALIRELLEDQASPSDEPFFSTADLEFDIQAGITLGPHRSPRRNATPYLRVANVQRGYLDLGDMAFLEASDNELPLYAVRPGDLLLVEGHANPNEIGRCALVRHDIGLALFQNHLFRLRSRRIDPEFAHLWLNSNYAKTYWYRRCATSSGLYTINSRNLRVLPVWVPDRATQDRIVQSIGAVDDRLELQRKNVAKLRDLKVGLTDALLTGALRVKEGG